MTDIHTLNVLAHSRQVEAVAQPYVTTVTEILGSGEESVIFPHKPELTKPVVSLITYTTGCEAHIFELPIEGPGNGTSDASFVTFCRPEVASKV